MKNNTLVKTVIEDYLGMVIESDTPLKDIFINAVYRVIELEERLDRLETAFYDFKNGDE